MDTPYTVSKKEVGHIFETIPILAGIGSSEQRLLLSHHHIEEVPEGVTVINQGEAGDKLYAILKGEIVVKRKDESGLWHDITHLYQGDVFGEIAILRQIKRTASIVTVKPCVFLTLYANEFLELYAQFPQQAKDNIQLVIAKRLQEIGHGSTYM